MSYTPSISVVRSWYVDNDLEPDRGEAFDRFIRKVQADAMREVADRFVSVGGKDVHDYADDVEAGK